MVSTTTKATGNTQDRTEKLGITLPKSILQKIDDKRADIPRSTYIRRAIESFLNIKTKKGAGRKNRWLLLKQPLKM